MAAGQMCMRAGGVGISGDHMGGVHRTSGLIFKSSFFGQPVTSVSTYRSVGARKKLSNLARRVLSMSLATEIAKQKIVNTTEPTKVDPRTVVSVILGGGAGTRLFPLTKRRAKPAVPIGGAYRLIDVPMSNCINSGINKVYILTQFNSASLNRHLARAYNFGNGVNFGDGFVE